ncbi:MAG: sialate O-acetylesterase [Phycisphaerales bacterium]
MFRKLFYFLVIVLFVSLSNAELKLPSIISDNMVLQADTNAPLWGTADSQAKIEITCSWTQDKNIVDANAAGKWFASVKTPKSGINCTITISSGDNSRTIKNILIGQVWLCSGQSNMQWAVKDANDANDEIAAADYPHIRLFTVQRKASAEPLDDTVGKWLICDSANIPQFSAVAYYFGRELHNKLNVPIGLINSSFGGTPAQAWTRKEILTSDNDLKWYWDLDQQIIANKPKYQAQFDEQLRIWKEQKALQPSGKPLPEPRLPGELNDKNRSSMLYNAMIHPVIPFAIKGAIWYQGESNINDALRYRKLFPAMIQNWRKDWKQGDFSFYYVQLAPFGKQMKKDPNGQPDLSVPPDSNWARVREAQSMTLKMNNTGMAVIMDIGEVFNIHPKNKQEVGKRLALWALAKDYGFKDIVYSSPMYKNMQIEEDKIRVAFDTFGSSLISKGNEIKGFSIAGSDKKFVWANAKLDGDTVIVWSDQVKNPTAVRYGWSDWIQCNLFNSRGLPVSPFRTDPE